MSQASRALLLLVDGASRGNPGPAGIGVVIKDAHGAILKEISESIGRSTNNVAEYRALLRALEEAKTLAAETVEVRSDSDLLVSQLLGTYRVKSPDLGPLYLEAIRLLGAFDRWSARHVPRGQNAAADALANRAIDQANPEQVFEFAVLVDRQDGGFIARVPALPGVRVKGKTRSEVMELAQLAAERAVERLRDSGKSIPKEERIRVRLS